MVVVVVVGNYPCEISGFRRRIIEAFALPGSYAVYVASSLPTFRGSLSVQTTASFGSSCSPALSEMFPNVAIFGSESVECFRDMVSKLCFKPFVTIPVVAVMTALIIHFMHNIRCISVQKISYFNFFSLFCVTSMPTGIVTTTSLLLLLLLLSLFH